MRTRSLVFLLVCVVVPGLRGGRSLAEAAHLAPAPDDQAVVDRNGDPLPKGAFARLGTERFSSSGQILSLAYCSDGKVLVGLERSGLIKVWDALTGKETRRFGSLVQTMAASPDGAFVIGCCRDGEAPPGRPWDKASTVRVWDPATGKALPWPAKHGGSVYAFAFSKDSKTLATAEQDGTIHLWEFPRGKEIRQFKGQDKPTLCMAFSPDGKYVLGGGKAASWCLWNVATGEVARSGQSDAGVFAVAFSAEGDLFAAAGGGLGVWKTETGENVRWLQKSPDFVASVAFAPDGKTLASGGSDRAVRLWDVAKGEELRQLLGSTNRIGAVTFSPDGKTVAAGGSDSHVRLWDVAKGKELQPAEGHHSIVWAQAFSPDSKTLATAASDTSIFLWDVTTGKVVHRLEVPDGVQGLAFTADGKTLASAGHRTARLWDTATGTETGKLTITSDDTQAYFKNIAFSPDGKTIATGCQDLKVRLWDIASGKEIRSFKTPNSIPSRVLFTAGGETLIAVGTGKSIQAWSVDTGAERFQVDKSDSNQFSVAVSADGRSVAGQGPDGTVHVWELATGKERAKFAEKEMSVWALSFSPDGRHLIGANSTNALSVWDLTRGQEAGQLQGHTCLARSLATSPDGKVLASGGSDGTVLLWDATKLPEAKRLVPLVLSPKELEDEWKALVGDDVPRAYQALWALRANPKATLALLKRDLQLAPAADTKKIAKLIKDLDDNTFAVREKATTDLGTLGGAAEDAARNALQTDPTPEARMRLLRVLEKYQVCLVAGDRLRALRMLELLEQIDTPEAGEMLKKLAENESDGWLAREAKAAIARLRARDGTKP